MSDQLICLATFPSVGLANIALGRLEVEGIRAYLEGETAAQMLWQMGPTISGVRLMVFEDQADKALAILESAQEHHADSDEEEADDDHEAASDPADDDEQPAWLTQRREMTTRAWRAAIIGVLMILCVPALNFYSMYLLFRHGLLTEEPQAPPDWRINATLWLNLAVFALWSVCLMAALRSGAM